MTQDTGAHADDPSETTVSIRQVVAYNIARARRSRGWTQKDLAERLTEITGRTWRNVHVSAAEASWEANRRRVRAFDVDELLAFAMALNLPVAWFFLPPPETPSGDPLNPDEERFVASLDGQGKRISGGLLAWLALSAADRAGDRDGLMTGRASGWADVVRKPVSERLANPFPATPEAFS